MKLRHGIVVSGIALAIALIICLNTKSPSEGMVIAVAIGCVVWGLVVLWTAVGLIIKHNEDEVRRRLEL